MAGIDDLLSTFMGQTNTALNAAPAPWQQELLETVNPEKVKRQNIARALAKASTAMATTPGNFLAGISAAAATGADAYLTGKDQAEDQRLKVQQLVQMQQQKDQDRRLALLLDAIGVQRNQIQDQRQADQDAYGKTKDEREWGLRKQESDARTSYYNNRGTGSTASNAAIERRIGTATTTYYRELDSLREKNFGAEPTQEEADALWNDVLRRYRIPSDWDTAATTGQQSEVPARTPQVPPSNEVDGNGRSPKSDSLAPSSGPGAQQSIIRSKAEYDALPSGSIYTAPDGTQRRKP